VGTAEKDHSLVRSMIRPERLEHNSHKLPRYFLLDGQQRLTALASVFISREKLKELLAELEEEMPFIFISLKKFPEEIFRLLPMLATSNTHGFHSIDCSITLCP
jgi:hypothetical protein